MDISHLYNAILSALIAVLAFVAKSLDRRITANEEKHASLHLIYAKRDDMEASFERIEATYDRLYDILRRIEDKLDRKADK